MRESHAVDEQKSCERSKNGGLRTLHYSVVSFPKQHQSVGGESTLQFLG